MEEKEKGGSTPEKAEEGNVTLTRGDYDRLDSVYTRIVNAGDDLISLVKTLSEERGSVASWYLLGNAQEELQRSINDIEEILYGRV